AQRHKDSPPRKNNVQMQAVVEKAAQGSAPSQYFKQDQSRRHRRHDQRQGDEGFDERFSRPIMARQEPRHRQARRQDDERAQGRNPRRKPDNLPFIGGHGAWLSSINPNFAKTRPAASASRYSRK